MASDSGFLGAEALFAEALDGLQGFIGWQYRSKTEIMLKMALSPDLRELEVIQSAFTNSVEYPHFQAMVYDNEGRLKRKDYSPEHYLKEFSPAGRATDGEYGRDDVDRIASQLRLRMWSVPVRFELTGDDEVDAHIRLLSDFLHSQGPHQAGNLVVDPVVENGVAGQANCFVYFVPEDANYLAEGSLFRISGRFHGKDPMTVIRGSIERSNRNSDGQVGTYSKFRTEYPAVLDWLTREKKMQIGASDRIIPFTPFHQFGVDGILIADASDNLKAAVSMVDCFAKGGRRLELITEGLIRSLGLPGNHGLASPMSTTLKDRKARPAKSLPFNRGEIAEVTEYFGRTLFFSDIELKVLRHFYGGDYAPGMTGQEVLRISEDRRAKATVPREGL